jgi:hypothetical protein
MKGWDQLVEASDKKTFTLHNPATTSKLADGRKPRDKNSQTHY